MIELYTNDRVRMSDNLSASHDKCVTMHENRETYSCNACSKTFSKVAYLAKHYEWHELQIKHIQSSHVVLDPVKIFSCDICTRGFLDHKEFKQHQKKYFKIELNNEKNNNQLEKPYKCEECGWRFVMKSTLEAHSVLHEPFPHICECGIGYYKKGDLDSHRRLVHPIFKAVQPTAPIVKQEFKVIYKQDPESESELEDSDNEVEYKPHSKVGPRLKAKLTYRKPIKKPNYTSKKPNNISKNKQSNNNAKLKFEINELGMYVCPICAKTYVSKTSLTLHMKDHASLPYKCDECPKTFKHNYMLINHKDKHRGIKNFSCNVCKKDFYTKASVETHMRTHTGEKPFGCYLCPKTFSQAASRNLHLLRHTGVKNYACETCDKRFVTACALSLHTRVHTGEKPLECKYCGKGFADPSALKRHELIHTGLKPYQCKLCPKAFCDNSALYRHKRFHEEGKKTVQCTICNKHLCDKDSWQKHMKIKHTVIKEDEKYECDHCSKKFVLKGNLVTHMKQQHLRPSFIKCDICDKKLVASSMKNHLHQVHLKDFEFKCEICEKLFQYLFQLNMHITRAHTNTVKEKNYECDHCHKAFVYKQDVTKHIVTSHLGIKCEMCQRSFSTTLQLREHKSSQGCKRCPKCHMAFRYRHDVDNHFIKHHVPKSEQQLYECDFCSKQFPIKETLAKHLKQVHGTMKLKFSCDHCNMSFDNRNSIRIHIWDKHMVSLYCNVCMKRFYHELEFKQHKREGCSLKQLPCDICEKKFTTNYGLKIHLLSHGPKTVECDLCGIRYKIKNELIRHMRSAHGFKKN